MRMVGRGQRENGRVGVARLRRGAVIEIAARRSVGKVRTRADLKVGQYMRKEEA